MWAGCAELSRIVRTELRTPDVVLAELAARQHGVVASRNSGAGFDARRSRIASGRASPPPSPRGLRRGSPPTLAARHGDGRGPRLRPDAALSHGSAAALWRIVPRWPTPTHVTAPSERDRPSLRVHRSPSRRDHPLRHPRHDPGAHARRPRRRPEPQATHPRRQRGPGPATRHRRRADHPPHPIPGPPHLTTHARAGRHQVPPRRRLRPLPQTPPPPTPRVQPDHRRPRSRRRLPQQTRHRTRQPPIPQHARAFEKDRDRDADLLNAGFSTLRITDHRLKHHETKEAKRLRDILRSR